MKKNALHKHRHIAMKWTENEQNYGKLSQAKHRPKGKKRHAPKPTPDDTGASNITK